MNKLWHRLVADRNWTLIFGLVFFVLVIIVLSLAYQQAVAWLMDEKAVPLRHVQVSGELNHTSHEAVAAQVMRQGIGSFFNVDVNAVQQRVEALPWVYQASVRKQWPDVLKVFVVEQQSVAVWNNDALLNVQGDVFRVPPGSGLSPLPRLYGPAGSEIDALQGYRDLDGLLRINGFTVDALTLSARFSWQLALHNGVVLKLGRREKVERVQRFIDLYAVISKHRPQSVVSVDLRYDTGMAVRWAENNKDEKNS